MEAQHGVRSVSAKEAVDYSYYLRNELNYLFFLFTPSLEAKSVFFFRSALGSITGEENMQLEEVYTLTNEQWKISYFTSSEPEMTIRLSLTRFEKDDTV